MGWPAKQIAGRMELPFHNLAMLQFGIGAVLPFPEGPPAAAQHGGTCKK